MLGFALHDWYIEVCPSISCITLRIFAYGSVFVLLGDHVYHYLGNTSLCFLSYSAEVLNLYLLDSCAVDVYFLWFNGDITSSLLMLVCTFLSSHVFVLFFFFGQWVVNGEICVGLFALRKIRKVYFFCASVIVCKLLCCHKLIKFLIGCLGLCLIVFAWHW